MNNRVLTEYDPVRPRLGAIDAAPVSSLIRGSGIGDAYKQFTIAERDEIAHRAAWVPHRIPCTSNEDFDPVYMRCLFDFGAQWMRAGQFWSDLPPYFVRPPVAPPTTRRPARPRT